MTLNNVTGFRIDDEKRAELGRYADLARTNLGGLTRNYVVLEWLAAKMEQFEHPHVVAELARVAGINGLTLSEHLAARESILRQVVDLPLGEDPLAIEW